MLTYKLSTLSKSKYEEILSRSGVDIGPALSKAKGIVDEVRNRGEIALMKYARKFDGYRSGPLSVPAVEIRASRGKVPKKVRDALVLARSRIASFHSKQTIGAFEFTDSCGTMGQKVVPLERVGVYVPGGTASYMSSVLMACIPARIAGVKEICICTPGKAGRVAPEILAAADLCDVTEVHPVGGAHAVAAMAYGTKSIKRVQKIVGPGGVIVSAAKLLVRNDCEIDFLAGPSEVLIIADGSADPENLALDMLAQLEHDPLARAVLVTDSPRIARRTRGILDRSIALEDRSEIVREASKKGAVFLLTESLGEAISFSNEYAPEHLLIDVRSPRRVLSKVQNAGSVFLGKHSSVAFGDYCSGANHILPTKGAASMKSALGVYDFLKVIPYQDISGRGARELAGAVEVLARAEGLPAHARAATSRSRKVR